MTSRMSFTPNPRSHTQGGYPVRIEEPFEGVVSFPLTVHNWRSSPLPNKSEVFRFSFTSSDIKMFCLSVYYSLFSGSTTSKLQQLVLLFGLKFQSALHPLVPCGTSVADLMFMTSRRCIQIRVAPLDIIDFRAIYPPLTFLLPRDIACSLLFLLLASLGGSARGHGRRPPSLGSFEWLRHPAAPVRGHHRPGQSLQWIIYQWSVNTPAAVVPICLLNLTGNRPSVFLILCLSVRLFPHCCCRPLESLPAAALPFLQSRSRIAHPTRGSDCRFRFLRRPQSGPA